MLTWVMNLGFAASNATAPTGAPSMLTLLGTGAALPLLVLLCVLVN